MRRSQDEILTTHTGSLPRPPQLTAMLQRLDRGELSGGEPDELRAQVRDAVADVVRRQAQAGVSVVNDGEEGKIGYATYVKERLEGFGGEEAGFASVPPEWQEFGDFMAQEARRLTFRRPTCDGPISYRGLEAVREDIATLRAALEGAQVQEAFMTAASPGVISLFLDNQYYKSHEEYISALADAMKAEYDAIHEAGLVLQLDCPDLALARYMFGDESLEDFRRRAEVHVEAINHATRDIPPEEMRMHLCWGNYEGPHRDDVPLADIIDIVLRARPAAISFEGANPRHEHEYHVFEDVKLPDGKVLIPGVLDSTTNYIEHPELVAERITRYAQLGGRENVIAGTDCGFSTFADHVTVDPAITWAKLGAMADGARLATERMW